MRRQNKQGNGQCAATSAPTACSRASRRPPSPSRPLLLACCSRALSSRRLDHGMEHLRSSLYVRMVDMWTFTTVRECVQVTGGRGSSAPPASGRSGDCSEPCSRPWIRMRAVGGSEMPGMRRCGQRHYEQCLYFEQSDCRLMLIDGSRREMLPPDGGEPVRSGHKAT